MFLLKNVLNGLHLDYQTRLRDWSNNRMVAINTLSILMIIVTCCFLLVLYLVEMDRWYYVFVAPPVYGFALYLSKKGKYVYSRQVMLFGSLAILSFWCFTNRRIGAEYALLGFACSTPMLLKKRLQIVIWFIGTIAIFSIYQFFDSQLPFVPNNSFNYFWLSNSIIAASVGMVFFQILLFRDLTFHYSSSLKRKNNQLDSIVARKETIEKELSQKNEEMHTLTDQLNWIVMQKTSELQVYLDAINVSIYSSINDPDGNVIRVNEPLLKATGYTSDELIGKSMRLLAISQNTVSRWNEMEDVIRSGNTWRGEICHQSKDGSYFWCDQVAIPVKNKDGGLNYFLILGLPITERKKNEQAREETLMLLEKIAFQTSHKVRGPLARIEGLVNLVQQDFVSPEEMKMVTRKLQQCSQEVNSATSDLVDFVNAHQSNIRLETPIPQSEESLKSLSEQ